MKLLDVGTVVATRQLDLSVDKTVTVLVGKPEKFPDADDYYCPYQILGLGNERVRRAGGVDSIQALELALKMIGTDLYTSKESQSGELTWSGGKKGDLGFPVPDVLRDLAPNQP
jgi:hypothetical protein